MVVNYIVIMQGSKKLFTGPMARRILKTQFVNEKQKWKVFVLLTTRKEKKKFSQIKREKIGIELKNGSEILYQVYATIML